MSKRSMTVLGLGICVAAAVLILLDWLSVGWGSALGVVGIGLLAVPARQNNT